MSPRPTRTFKLRLRGTGYPPAMELPTGQTCKDCSHWTSCGRFASVLAHDEVCKYDPSRFQTAFRLDRAESHP